MIGAIHERLDQSMGAERLRRLHASRVGVVGAGALASRLLPELAMLQVPTFVVDPGEVELANLGNQVLPAVSVGEPKVAVRARQMAALNPSCPVRTARARIEDLGLGAFADCDVLLGALDSRTSRLALGRIAQRLGRDYVDAAVDAGGRRIGKVTWYRSRAGANACAACPYDAARLAAVAREELGAGCPSWRAPREVHTPPTLAASSFVSVVAGFQMQWALDALLGERQEHMNHQLQIFADGTPRIGLVELARGRACASPHRPLEPLRAVACRDVGELLEQAARDLGAEPDALVFPDRDLVRGLACPACRRRSGLVKRREAFTDAEVRCACGAGLEPVAITRRLEREAAASLARVGWRELGLPEGELVTAEATGRESVHYLVGQSGSGAAEEAA